MGIVRPTSKRSSETNNFYGICEIAILGFSDFSSKYEWADIYLDVEVKQKGSDYTKSVRLAGSLEKDPDGSVTGGSVLNRLYHFFDVLNVQAGINAQGNWETADGQPIDDIATYLNKNHGNEGKEPETFSLLAYVYKEKPKQVGGKVYTRVHHKVHSNTEEGRIKLTDDVKWFKDKGFIKEAPIEGPEGHNKVSVAEMDKVFGSDALDNM